MKTYDTIIGSYEIAKVLTQRLQKVIDKKGFANLYKKDKLIGTLKSAKDLKVTLKNDKEATYYSMTFTGNSLNKLIIDYGLLFKTVAGAKYNFQKGGDVDKNIKKRLEYLRKELRAASISYGELAELQSLAKHIDPADVELLEAAGVEEKYAQGGDVADIEKFKRNLIKKAKSKGLYENFGQAEVRKLEDKYGYTQKVSEFDTWAMNFDISQMAQGGDVFTGNTSQSIINKMKAKGHKVPVNLEKKAKAIKTKEEDIKLAIKLLELTKKQEARKATIKKSTKKSKSKRKKATTKINKDKLNINYSASQNPFLEKLIKKGIMTIDSEGGYNGQYKGIWLRSHWSNNYRVVAWTNAENQKDVKSMKELKDFTKKKITPKKEKTIISVTGKKIKTTIEDVKKKHPKRTKGRTDEDINKDLGRTAKKAGRRISVTGKVYYETRPNRTDAGKKKITDRI